MQKKASSPDIPWTTPPGAGTFNLHGLDEAERVVCPISESSGCIERDALGAFEAGQIGCDDPVSADPHGRIASVRLRSGS